MFKVYKSIEKNTAQEIKNYLLSNDVPYYFNSQTCLKITYDNENQYDTPQMVHTLVRNGETNSSIEIHKNILHLLNVKYEKVIRAKINITFPVVNSYKTQHNVIHTDFKEEDKKRLKVKKTNKLVSLIYYINDSDGDTILYDEQGLSEKYRCSPKMGKSLMFDSMIPHCGSNPFLSDYRAVLNIVLEVKP